MTRPLGRDRAQAYERLMPRLSILEKTIAGKENIDPSSLFSSSSSKEIWLEIGFGGGEHLVALMQKYPNINFIGAEPFINGVAGFCAHLENKNNVILNEAKNHFLSDPSSVPQDEKFKNIRIFPDDAMLLVRALKNESIDRLYILNPDPWPKKRHHKRRLVQQETLTQFARILKPGGLLLACTDVDSLAEWMVTQMVNHSSFRWLANNCNDWKNPPENWASTTRYREKGAKAGRKMTYLLFKKTCKPLT